MCGPRGDEELRAAVERDGVGVVVGGVVGRVARGAGRHRRGRRGGRARLHRAGRALCGLRGAILDLLCAVVSWKQVSVDLQTYVVCAQDFRYIVSLIIIIFISQIVFKVLAIHILKNL